MSSESFSLGNLVVVREDHHPYFWLVKRDGVVIDRDQYSNDIRERFDLGAYTPESTDIPLEELEKKIKEMAELEQAMSLYERSVEAG